MIKTRFRIPDKMPYSAAVFLIMLFTLMSMQPVDPVEPWFQDTGQLLPRFCFILLILVLVRLRYIIIYTLLCIFFDTNLQLIIHFTP